MEEARRCWGRGGGGCRVWLLGKLYMEEVIGTIRSICSEAVVCCCREVGKRATTQVLNPSMPTAHNLCHRQSTHATCVNIITQPKQASQSVGSNHFITVTSAMTGGAGQAMPRLSYH